ncbi:Trp biosynthesis-associated membrane protein [Glycomyces tenuis]|uniref:Trp biosynthesis-associated membrane protein n=1 Tax=Glycomyces tenuis TaxID=58116 RepID=UPI000400AA57|nr:Trp biosynthesis-associated membrane protein [Glycomyces tenuis]
MRPGNDRPRVLTAGIVSTGIAAICAVVEWSSETVENTAGLTTTASRAGTEVVPWLLPCVLAGGAAFLALLVAGRRTRRVVSVVAALAGLAVLLTGAFNFMDGAAPIGAAVAGLVMAAAGASAAVNSGRWPEPAARYDSKSLDGDAIAEDPAKLWNALDSGQDPSSPNITASAQEKGRS